ncbi:CocE/NonD family hydrolase [Actinomadura harenae]|uniref:CocE/NonD family hydrolase n=1 Tax=Actinomadura harenae TaxID=2483351 RepID=A0A3M2LWG3_9ACTN|nr:CocE/NonD family hydrolase [Actinomadura harenae]RMI41250.1 CocE/NonD family hydrolase [Actinomadura harenae]
MAPVTPTARLPRAAGRVPRGARLHRRLLRGLPEARYPVGFEGGIDVPAADGVPLKTDHYVPLGEGDFPTLLVSSPYTRGFPWAAVFGVAFAEQGFHVVLQSRRGTGGSGGTFHPWQDEADDGHATVTWLRGQDWFTGALGTIGASAQSHASAALAQDPPPELRAAVALVPLHDPHAFFFTGGVLNLENALVASTALSHEGRMTPAHLADLARISRRLRRGLRADEITGPPVLRHAVAHPDPAGAHWTGAKVTPRVPTCVISGWQDVTLDQAVREYETLRGAGTPTRLVVGPWTHTTALGQGLPEAFDAAVTWFRAHLTGEAQEPGAPLRLNVSGEWRDFDTWPGVPDMPTWEHGPELPATLRYEPDAAPPSIGGALLSHRAGVKRDDRYAAHQDVLLFETAVLDEPLEIVGVMDVRLRLSGHGDLFVRLSDVDAGGRSHNVADGVARTAGGETSVRLGAVGHRFAAGHRLRLLVSGPPSPRYAKGGAATFTVAAPPEPRGAR